MELSDVLNKYEDVDEVPVEIIRAFSSEFTDCEMVCFHNHIFSLENGRYLYQGYIAKAAGKYLLIAIQSSSVNVLDAEGIAAYKDM